MHLGIGTLQSWLRPLCTTAPQLRNNIEIEACSEQHLSKTISLLQNVEKCIPAYSSVIYIHIIHLLVTKCIVVLNSICVWFNKLVIYRRGRVSQAIFRHTVECSCWNESLSVCAESKTEAWVFLGSHSDIYYSNILWTVWILSMEYFWLSIRLGFPMNLF